jgi:hypothetical protein
MTPRQINAFCFLAGRRRERELAQLLGVTALANSEDGDAIKKQIEKWEGDQ